MTRSINRSSIMLMALCLVGGDLYADGQDRAGTAAAPELLIPVGARDMALGGASIATTGGIEALHWNPAGLARSRTSADAMFSTMSYLADIRVNYLAAGAHFERLGSLAFNIKTLDLGDIPITTETSPDGTGATFSPTFFAKMLTDRIAVGATTHYIVNRIERVDATAVSFSAGLQYADLGGIGGLDMGVALKHIGSRLKYDGPALLRSGQLDGLRRPAASYKVEASSADLPSTFEIGLGYRYPAAAMGEVNLSSVFRHSNFSYDQWKVGCEYVYDGFFAVRGGFDYAADAADDPYIFGTSFGFGLDFDLGTLRDVKVDYAYTTVDFFDPMNTFSFQIGF